MIGLGTWIDAMLFGIVSFLRPLSSTFLGLASLDAATTWQVTVTFLPSHRTLGACLAFLGNTSAKVGSLYKIV